MRMLEINFFIFSFGKKKSLLSLILSAAFLWASSSRERCVTARRKQLEMIHLSVKHDCYKSKEQKHNTFLLNLESQLRGVSSLGISALLSIISNYYALSCCTDHRLRRGHNYKGGCQKRFWNVDDNMVWRRWIHYRLPPLTGACQCLFFKRRSALQNTPLRPASNQLPPCLHCAVYLPQLRIFILPQEEARCCFAVKERNSNITNRFEECNVLFALLKWTECACLFFHPFIIRTRSLAGVRPA